MSQFSSLIGQLARGFLVVNGVEFIPRFRRAVQAQQFGSYRRAGFLQALTILVAECTPLTLMGSADNHVTHLECPLAYQHGGGRATLSHGRFNHVANGAPVWIGLQFHDFGLE